MVIINRTSDIPSPAKLSLRPKDSTAYFVRPRSVVKLVPSYAIAPWPKWTEENLKDVENAPGAALEPSNRFHDPSNMLMPNSLKPKMWVHPGQIFKKNPKVVDASVEHIDLINPNIHIFETSCLIRRILCELSELYDLKTRDPFFCPTDDESLSSRYHPWRPWNNIVSFPLKEGKKKNSNRTPQISPTGRYAVRLFFLAHWRIIMVDDTIPVLPSGLFALPVTENFELWPLLITKALMKIAIMKLGDELHTETAHSSFSAIKYLTGWVEDKEKYVSSQGVDASMLWDYLNLTLPKYNPKHPPKEMEFPADALFPCEPLSPGKKAKKQKKQKKKSKKKKKTKSKSKSKSKSSSGKSKSSNTSESSGSQISGSNKSKTRSKKGKKKKKGSKKGKKKKDSVSSAGTSESEPCAKDFVEVIRSEEVNAKICTPEELPTLEEILTKVQGIIGAQKRQLVREAQKHVETDDPVSLIATLEKFYEDFVKQQDRELKETPPQHPVLLKQVRDRPLETTVDPCRPPTPLWKTYRWKEWAMEKGIIPKKEGQELEEETHPRKVLLLTPTLLREDWKVDIPDTGVTKDNLDEVLAKLKIPKKATVSDLPDLLRKAAMPKTPKSKSPKKKQKSKGKKGKGKRGKSKSKSRSSTAASSGGDTTSDIESEASSSSKKTDDSGNESIESRGRSKKSKKSGKSKTRKGKKSKKKEKTKKSKSVAKIPLDATGQTWDDVDDVSKRARELTRYYSGQTRLHGSYYFVVKASRLWLNSEHVVKPVRTPRSSTGSSKGSGTSATPKLLHSGSPEAIAMMEDQTHGSIARPFVDSIGPSEDLLLPTYGKYIRADNWSMDNLDDPHSGNYIFTDSWTEQTILFSLEGIQDYDIYFMGRLHRLSSSDSNLLDQTEIPSRLRRPGVMLVVKPWDWTKEESFDGSVYTLMSKDDKTLRLKLPPGRHLFRFWLMEHGCMDSMDSKASVDPDSPEPQEMYAQSVLTIMSKTPIYVGDRETAQDLMTLSPIVFLRMCDELSRRLWGLLLSFGKPKLMDIMLKLLRKSYLPPDNDQKLSKVHELFDNVMLDALQSTNGGPLDFWTLFALRVLFMNPNLGKQATAGNIAKSTSNAAEDGSSEDRSSQSVIKSSENSVKLSLASFTQTPSKGYRPPCLALQTAAAIEIQRYIRGWIARRFLAARSRKFCDVEKLELGVRKIAYLLASSMGSYVLDERRLDKVIFPVPPLWAVNSMEEIIAKFPSLLEKYPHYSSLKYYINICDVENYIPAVGDPFSKWIPFYRAQIRPDRIRGDQVLHFEMISNLPAGIYLRIVDNDTNEPLCMFRDRMWVGTLKPNKNGYTVIGYKVPAEQCRYAPPSDPIIGYWKFRQINPATEPHTELIETGLFPVPKLNLHRFSGYYFPNYDSCVCRYEMEFEDDSEVVSLNFRASDVNAKFLLRVWNHHTGELVYEKSFTASVIVPSISLRSKSLTATSDYTATSGGSDETATESENRPLHKFIFSVFLLDNSWKMTPTEWEFVSLEMKRYWQETRAFVTEQLQFQQSLALQRDSEKPSKTGSLDATAAEGATDDKSARSSTSLGEKLTPDKDETHLHKASYSSQESDRDLDGESTASILIKYNKSETDHPDVAISSERNADTEPSMSSSNKDEPTTHNPAPESRTNTAGLPVPPPTTVSVESEPEDWLTYGNLTIYSGGPNSRLIADTRQPHWVLEVLTEFRPKFKSNLQILKENLRSLKQKWRQEGVDKYACGLKARYGFLQDHLIPIETIREDATTNWFSCLHVDDSFLRAMGDVPSEGEGPGYSVQSRASTSGVTNGDHEAGQLSRHRMLSYSSEASAELLNPADSDSKHTAIMQWIPDAVQPSNVEPVPNQMESGLTISQPKQQQASAPSTVETASTISSKLEQKSRPLYGSATLEQTPDPPEPIVTHVLRGPAADMDWLLEDMIDQWHVPYELPLTVFTCAKDGDQDLRPESGEPVLPFLSAIREKQVKALKDHSEKMQHVKENLERNRFCLTKFFSRSTEHDGESPLYPPPPSPSYCKEETHSGSKKGAKGSKTRGASGSNDSETESATSVSFKSKKSKKKSKSRSKSKKKSKDKKKAKKGSKKSKGRSKSKKRKPK